MRRTLTRTLRVLPVTLVNKFHVEIIIAHLCDCWSLLFPPWIWNFVYGSDTETKLHVEGQEEISDSQIQRVGSLGGKTAKISVFPRCCEQMLSCWRLQVPSCISSGGLCHMFSIRSLRNVTESHRRTWLFLPLLLLFCRADSGHLAVLKCFHWCFHQHSHAVCSLFDIFHA